MNINLVLPVNNPRILTIEDINSLGLADNITCNITLPNNHLLEITSNSWEALNLQQLLANGISEWHPSPKVVANMSRVHRVP